MNCLKERRCNRCKRVLTITVENFNRNAASPSGFSTICNICKKEQREDMEIKKTTRKFKDESNDYDWFSSGYGIYV